jgi:hypothetical protein
MKRLSPERVDLAFRALELRAELDALLAKHGAKLSLGWEGKYAYLQALFPEAGSNEALTLIKVRRDGRMTYLTTQEEPSTDDARDAARWRFAEKNLDIGGLNIGAPGRDFTEWSPQMVDDAIAATPKQEPKP